MAVLIKELYQYAENPDRQVDSCTLAAVSAVRNLAYDEGCVRGITEANGVVPMVGILAAAPSLKAKTQVTARTRVCMPQCAHATPVTTIDTITDGRRTSNNASSLEIYIAGSVVQFHVELSCIA